MGVLFIQGFNRAPDKFQFQAQIPLDFDHHRLIGCGDRLAGLTKSMKVARLVWTTRPDFLTRTMDGIFGIADNCPDGEAQSSDRFQQTCADGFGPLIGQFCRLQGDPRTQFADHIEDIIPFLGLHRINAQAQPVTFVSCPLRGDPDRLGRLQQAEKIDDQV